MADTINTLITGIENSKSDIADAIENKGVTVPSGTKLAGMANLVNQIPVMHGPVSSTDGNLAAFDGTDGDTLKDSGIAMTNVATKSGNNSFSGTTTFTNSVTFDNLDNNISFEGIAPTFKGGINIGSSNHASVPVTFYDAGNSTSYYTTLQLDGNVLKITPHDSVGGTYGTISFPAARNSNATLATTDYVSANPSTTTGTLTGITINGTSYAIPTTADTNYYATSDFTSSNGTKIATGYSSGTASATYNLYVPNATASQAGLVTTGAQTFAGNKTFTGTIYTSYNSGMNHGYIYSSNNVMYVHTTTGDITIDACTDVNIHSDTTGKVDIQNGRIIIPASVTSGTTQITFKDVNKETALSTTSYTPTYTFPKLLDNDSHIIATTDDIPGNEAAAYGGTTLSVVTTGDKYNWNNKASANNYHTPVYTSSANSALKLGTGVGISDMYVPAAGSAQAGIVTTGSQTFSGQKTFSDSSSIPLAVTYASQSANSFMTVTDSSNTNTAVFNLPAIYNSNLTYTLPSTSGELALASDIPTNIKNGATTGSLEQIRDGSSFTFVNPNSPLNNTSVSIGIATGTYASIFGGKGRVEGKRGFVNGTQVVATGNYSHAEGNNTHAAGVNSHAEGIQTYANGSAAHAEGSSTAATETGAHSEGYGTHADGVYTHTEGSTNYALGDNSHAEGGSNIVGVYSGPSPAPTPGPAPDPGTAVHAEGMGSHAEGNNNTITGAYSHAEGQGNTVSSNRAHAEGNGNTVSGLYAHAEGNSGVASGEGAHSEGLYGHAVGNYSHAEGAATYANGLYSHAAGQDSTANGTASFASGYHVTANRDYQTVLGKYNLGQADTLLEVGKGTAENARGNAFEVYADGHATVGLMGSTNLSVATKQYVDNHTPNITTEDYVIAPTLTIIIREEYSVANKVYYRVYDGQDTSGTLVYENTDSTNTTPSPQKIKISSGHFYIDCKSTNGVYWFGWSNEYSSSITNVSYGNITGDNSHGYLKGDMSASGFFYINNLSWND